MRNPWASELYTGSWCDGCVEWDSVSDSDKAELGYEHADDGVFFMPIDLYHETFDNTHFSRDIHDWSNDYFLMLDDNSQADNPGDFYYCGAECTKHNLTITTDVTQEVYLTAHLWDSRGMSKSCNQHLGYGNTGKYHSFYRPGAEYVMVFNEGAMQLDAFTLEAGQPMDVWVEFDFSKEELSNDWSVTIWAASGNVTVTHKKGYTSDTMPVIGAKPASEEETPF